MAIYKGKEFTGMEEAVDFNQYIDCTFTRCRIIYRGGALPKFENCKITECQWSLEDAGHRTLNYLGMLYHNMGSMGQELIEMVFNTIKTNPEAPPVIKGPLN